MEQIKLAPVVVFAYKRKKHLEDMINSLMRDSLASQTEVFIFVDGPKGEKDVEQVNEVRNYVLELAKKHNFKTVNTQISETNKGLANSIIGGVSKIMADFGRTIVIEDDVIIADRFLEYMNGALDFYKDDGKIWSVGAFSFVKKFPEGFSSDVFFTQRSSSYAWGCWVDRWEKIDWLLSDYKQFKCDISKRSSFNRWGDDRAMMLDSQIRGVVDSWAIRFDYAMWKNGMYNVVPTFSRCTTTGHDGSGTHSREEKDDIFAVDCVKLDNPIKYEQLKLYEEIRKEFRRFFEVSILVRIKRFLFGRRKK